MPSILNDVGDLSRLLAVVFFVFVVLLATCLHLVDEYFLWTTEDYSPLKDESALTENGRAGEWDVRSGEWNERAREDDEISIIDVEYQRLRYLKF